MMQTPWIIIIIRWIIDHRKVLLTVGIPALLAILILGICMQSGTGFAAKTLWDWLELLIIPAVLAVGALLFNRAERASERKIAADRSQDARMQFYLDTMTGLLLDKGLRESKENSVVRDIARSRTLTTLRVLDAGRRNVLLRFLRGAELIGKGSLVLLSKTDLSGADLREASLSNANLSGADLRGANLSGTNLSETNLSGADLRGANLSGADLRGANLSRADLSRADLREAYLHEADLREAKLIEAYLSGAYLSEADLRDANLVGADLSEADLSWAKLSEAKVTDEQLATAISLEGAIMPDGTEYEEPTPQPGQEAAPPAQNAEMQDAPEETPQGEAEGENS